MTTRQNQVAKCLSTFIDRNYYPDFVATDADWRDFFSVESHGKKSVSAESLERIKPLLEAKGDYDLQIRMVMSEVAEWWANGWGWANPLNAVVFEASVEPDLAVYVEALEKIRESFKRDSLQAIVDYTGFTTEERNKFLKRYEQSCKTQAA